MRTREVKSEEVSITVDQVNLENYPGDYSSHCLEIYKIYLEMADRISCRRQNANSFFLTISTTIIGYIGYVKSVADFSLIDSQIIILSIIGIAVCLLWYKILQSYKRINSGKFKIVQEIEKKLPVSPFQAEWALLAKGKDFKIYTPATKIEIFIPSLFVTLYFVTIYQSL